MSALASPARRFALVVAAALALPLASACKEDKGAAPGTPQGTPPPPPASALASGSAAGKSACDPSLAGIDDAKLAAVLPAQVGSFCAQKSGVESYGEGTKKKIDDITDVIDGGGDIYVHSYYAKRWDRLKFHDAKKAKAEVEITISSYDRPADAYGFFTDRVISGADPDPEVMAKQQRRPYKAVAVGGVGALGKAHALLWRDRYLVELDYIDDDATPDELTTAADAALPTFLQAIDAKIGGQTELPADVRLLPTEAEGRVPFGVEYVPPKYTRPQGESQGLALAIPGGYATAFMKAGDKRWRVVAVTRDDRDAAKDALGAFRKFQGALPVKDVGDEAVHFAFPIGSGADATKGEGVAGRDGGVVFAVLDDELALGDPAAKGANPRLSKDEKIAKVKALLASKKAGAASPSASAAPSSSAQAAPSGAAKPANH